MDQFNYALQTVGDQSMHMVIAFKGLLDEERLRTATATVLTAVPVPGSRFVECGAPSWEHLNGTGHDALVLIHHSADPSRDLPAVLALPVNPATGPHSAST